MEPVPSIHDTINRGTNGSVARSTLPDPANPNWSGAPLVTRQPESGSAPRVAASDGRNAAAPAPEPASTRWSEPPRQLAAAPTTDAAPEPGPAPLPEPDDAAPLPGADSQPDVQTRVQESPGFSPVAGDEVRMPELPTLPAAEPAAAVSPAASPELAPAPAPSDEDGDPLLGPKPQLMPSMDGPAPEKPKASTDAEADAVSPAPELAPAPAPGSASHRPSPSGDGAVRRVVATSAAPAADVVDDANWKRAGLAAARVGDDVITLAQLQRAVAEAVRKQGGQPGQLKREELNMVGKVVLASLIERTMLVQEAKHQLKNDEKQIGKLLDFADKFWREKEVPLLLRQYSAEDERQLRRKLEEEKRSLSALQQDFRQEFLAHVYVEQKLGGKLAVGLPEMLEYYNKHVRDPQNHRTPAIVWREILVEKGRHASPAEARAKVDGLLARLRKGEDFAKLAAAESEGPARIKADGGLMETAPGSYVVQAVNAAIESIPLKAVSDVIEGPDSYHIVLVESRRGGGPASFAELQDQIRKSLEAEKSFKYRRELLADIRKRTIVTTIFDGTESDPREVAR